MKSIFANNLLVTTDETESIFNLIKRNYLKLFDFHEVVDNTAELRCDANF